MEKSPYAHQHTMITPSQTAPVIENADVTKKKEVISYKRDANGNLLCHLCNFRPKPTPAHPHGNPSTLHYHLKKKHTGDCSHVCKHCGYAFLHKLALETHIASRHPEANQKVEMFRCDIQGCQFESLTRGNLEIHKARKHYSNLVNETLQVIEAENAKHYRCLCCTKDFKSGTSYHYHILKCLESHERLPVA
jgi:hypothetical protein